MIDTSTLYEKVLVEGGLNSVKHLRDQWNYSSDNSLFSDLTDLCDICGADGNQYSYIVRASKKATFETINTTVFSLLQAYGIAATPVQLTFNEKNLTHTYVIENVLYVFREFGINKRLPNEIIEKLKERLKISDYKYIIPAEGDVFAEIINHNDDESDPSRGTHSYTLQYFFSEFFAADEYEKFKEFYKKYVQAVRSYFGVAIVKTLRPNALFSYKRSAREKINSFEYQKRLSDFCPALSLSSQQKAIIENQYFQQGYSSALTGKLPFATCFMTAEWLYDSFLESAGAIDLSAISMGYFKAIEQFLYDFIGFHTTEKDGKRRDIKFSKYEQWTSFTDSNYADHRESCTLGTLTKFLQSRYQYDLIRPEIDANTRTIIVELLSKTSGLRNGYFHKDNIDEWEKVKKDRALAYLFFYYVLGSYKFEGDAKSHFEFMIPTPKDETQKLFEYTHALSFAADPFSPPILYFGDDAEKSPYVVPMHDNFVEYDEYGDPTFSGLYYYFIGHPEFTQKKGKDDLPDVICEGRLIIGKGEDQPIGIKVTGPEKVIFKDGKFLG